MWRNSKKNHRINKTASINLGKKRWQHRCFIRHQKKWNWSWRKCCAGLQTENGTRRTRTFDWVPFSEPTVLWLLIFGTEFVTAEEDSQKFVIQSICCGGFCFSKSMELRKSTVPLSDGHPRRLSRSGPGTLWKRFQNNRMYLMYQSAFTEKIVPCFPKLK